MVDDEEIKPRSALVVAFPLAALALVVGCGIGAVVGYVAYAQLSEPKVVIPPPTVIKAEISDADLAILCEDLTLGEAERARNAQARVSDLQGRLAAREEELDKLKKEAAGDETKKAAARKKWAAMEQEIATLKEQLTVAETERNEVRAELKQTLVQLDRQIRETEKFKAKAIEYKEQSTSNLWSSFNNGAKVDICDKGTRKRHADCHDAVDASLAPLRQKFTVCVDTYQAVPVLKQAEKNEDLPQFAQWLPDDNKFTKKGWYIIFCDPTLPEAGGMDEFGNGPGESTEAPTGFPEGLDDPDL